MMMVAGSTRPVPRDVNAELCLQRVNRLGRLQENHRGAQPYALFGKLLEVHARYWQAGADAELPDDIEPLVARKLRRDARRAFYRKLTKQERLVGVNPLLYRDPLVA